MYAVAPPCCPLFYPSFLSVTCNLPKNPLTIFTAIFTNFIISGNPSADLNQTIPAHTADVLRSWPTYSQSNPIQINFNETGGVVDTNGHDPRDPFGITITQYDRPGLTPSFSLVNAYTWEGGRGKRCDFWRDVGVNVPE